MSNAKMHQLVDDLFGRPVAASAAAAAPGPGHLVDTLFGSATKTVVSTNSLRDNVLGSLTQHAGGSSFGAGAGASPARPTVAPLAGSANAQLTSATQHLLFLVHGIGEHQDFHDDKAVSWDGSEGMVGGNHEFRALLARLAASRMGEVPLSLTVSSVEWHSALRSPAADGDAAAVSETAASDALLGACCPAGVSGLRSFTRESLMDVLYYTSVPHAQLIVDTVADQMARRWTSFLLEHPGWSGSVHLLGHSLGSLIVLDMLTHAGATWHGVRYPTLPFGVTNLFVCGSPAPLFLVARRQVVSVASAEAAAAATPLPLPCENFFNLVNAMDPIAHLYKPLILHRPEESAAGASSGTASADSACRWAIRTAATHKSLVEAQRAPPPPQVLPATKALPAGASLAELLAAIREAEASRGAVDHHMTPKAAWTAVGAALNAPAAHSSYWFSEDVGLFVLAQMLVPWARLHAPTTPPATPKATRGRRAPPTPGTPRTPRAATPSAPATPSRQSEAAVDARSAVPASPSVAARAAGA